MSRKHHEEVVNEQPIADNTPVDQARGPEPLSVDEVNALQGELPYGTLGWVELDGNGKPIGPVTVNPPPGVPAARVAIGVPLEQYNVHTPSGAPITAVMQPCPDYLLDAAFHERNPTEGVAVPLHSNNRDVSVDNPDKPSNQD